MQITTSGSLCLTSFCDTCIKHTCRHGKCTEQTERYSVILLALLYIFFSLPFLCIFLILHFVRFRQVLSWSFKMFDFFFFSLQTLWAFYPKYTSVFKKTLRRERSCQQNIFLRNADDGYEKQSCQQKHYAEDRYENRDKL